MPAGWNEPLPVDAPDVSLLVTEDDTPVDNLFSEKQQRLLTEPLDTSWAGPPAEERDVRRPFLVTANVGLYASPKQQPLVPDVLLSVDVQAAADLWKKENRVYFLWEFGKPPNLVIEIVSNREGEELGKKRRAYARMGIAYYVVYDPQTLLSDERLTVFAKTGDLFLRTEPRFEALGLGLVEWDGTWSQVPTRWLRWTDLEGRLIPTGQERAAEEAERAAREAERAAREAERAAREAERATAAEDRARALAERLRALGVDPDL